MLNDSFINREYYLNYNIIDTFSKTIELLSVLYEFDFLYILKI